MSIPYCQKQVFSLSLNHYILNESVIAQTVFDVIINVTTDDSTLTLNNTHTHTRTFTLYPDTLQILKKKIDYQLIKNDDVH